MLRNRNETFECDCHAHAFGLREFWKDYDPNVINGVDVETETYFDDNYVDINIDFWYGIHGEGYYGSFLNRLKGAIRLLRGRRYTFDSFTFRPYQIKELSEYLVEEYRRVRVKYNDDGVAYHVLKKGGE